MFLTPEQLASLAVPIFESAGCEPKEAERVALRLIESNLVGHDSHGVIRIPSYVQWLRDGKVLANKSLQVVLENETIAVVDGQFGLGQTVGEQATRLGIDKSSKHGVAVIGLKNSGHLGRIGDWAEMAADAGKISLHFVSSNGAGMLVAPYGSAERRLGANPIAAGVPTGRGAPIILDMSACTVAEGKVRVALNQGEPLPEGCIIDSDGNPTTDPRKFYSDPPGAILPIAGHKGSGLSFIIELLSGALTGNMCSHPDHAWRVVNGMLSIIIEQTFFGAQADFFAEVQRYVDFVKSARAVTKDGEILLPGEIEQRTKARRLRDGIELDNVTWAQICDTARTLGVVHNFPVPAPGDVLKPQAGLSIPACGPPAGDQ
jgi:hydroxycarboxylate dehydrogenase B